MKVNLPNKGEPLAFPTIAIKAAVDKDCKGWGIKDFENDERAPSREVCSYSFSYHINVNILNLTLHIFSVSVYPIQ